MSRTLKIWMIIGVAILGASMAGLAVFVYRNAKPRPVSPPAVQTQPERFRDGKTGFEVQIPNDLTRTPLSSNDHEERISLRLTGQGSVPLSILVRSENELKRLNDGGGDLLGKLLTNTSLSFPQLYKDYKVIDQKRYSINDHPAGEVQFTYTNQGTVLKQRFVIIVRDDDVAQYIVMQATSEGFDSVNQRYFESLIASAKFAEK